LTGEIPLENRLESRPPRKEGFLAGTEGGQGPRAPGLSTDDELLDGCRRGDVAAFERLYELYGGRMKSLARNLLGRETDAEDAVQEAFLKVYRGAASFRGGAALSTWIYRILVNTCYDLLRRRQRRSESALEPTPEGPEPAIGSSSSDHSLRIAIEQGVARLRPRHRDVFLLSAVEGFSHREISEVLEIPEGTSRTLLFEAKRRLQEILSARPEISA
jgi:RNA polymerase sigma-70 factor (ECF subfamily)